jgi:hypothetical protein
MNTIILIWASLDSLLLFFKLVKVRRVPRAIGEIKYVINNEINQILINLSN